MTLRREATAVAQQISRSDDGDAMVQLVAALTAPVEDVVDWSRDQGDQTGWAMVLDIDQCPDFLLSWLARFRGVTLPPGITPTEARRRILEARGWQRGTRTALISDLLELLTGAKTIYLYERYRTPWDLGVVTYTSQTPDPAKVLAVLQAGKAIGIRLTYAANAGWPIGAMEDDPANTTIGALEDRFATIADLEDHIAT